MASLFKTLNLQTGIPRLSTEKITALLYLDKKVEYGKIRWVLPQSLGRVAITAEIPVETVKDTLLELGGK